MLIDSLEMNNFHLQMIQDSCLESKSKLILITHGTDKMTDTAKHLIKANIQNKVIVITGAMIPYAFGSSSDGFFNLGSALSALQNLKKGLTIISVTHNIKNTERANKIIKLHKGNIVL